MKISTLDIRRYLIMISTIAEIRNVLNVNIQYLFPNQARKKEKEKKHIIDQNPHCINEKLESPSTNYLEKK